MKIAVTFVLLLGFVGMALPSMAGAPASPVASPVAIPGCDGLEDYFGDLATLTRGNEGFLAVRANPSGVFGLSAEDADAIAGSLEALITELDSVAPPSAAAPYHDAYVDLIDWYRDLVEAQDFATHQQIINRDKQLIPAISRAMFYGQSTCGTDSWNTAYTKAFGEDR